MGNITEEQTEENKRFTLESGGPEHYARTMEVVREVIEEDRELLKILADK